MEQARAAVDKVTGNRGHKTEVEENVRPAVVQETVRPTQLEEVTQAKQRDVHQDHYHTTVQPLTDREVLPEQHRHQMAEAEEREFHHGNHDEERRLREQEMAKFQDSRQVESASVSQSQRTVEGESVHHHVHETVQPIVQKEVIQPEVVHTTKPIHEIHHSSSQFHGQSVLPTKSLNEVGGEIPTGSTGNVETYEGVPRKYNQKFQTEQTEADRHPDKKGVDGPGSHHTGGTGLADNEEFVEDEHMVRRGERHSGHHHGQHHTGTSGTTGTTGMTGTSGTGGVGSQGYEQGRGEDLYRGNQTGLGGSSTSRSGEYPGESTGTSGMTGTSGTTGTSGMTGTSGHHSGTSGTTGTTGTSDTTGTSGTHQKASLLDRINPFKDTDGDGKKGIMD
ncbi:hypothetical protein LTR10_018471 [Elasticomyces elasticus]|uniref:Allergen n=1 Tax=Exophiala sideris TaxID=1016849 RepID=A0ABR0J0K8_9EURO|nr:hypothetical protein LTR10_018471 [Elasticomyces elasticus]KAK5023938.1 hypothetical protein LTS07_009064 [Exophiala sideris]KAK5030046.1 hypothetical protein LTR13_008358 [Exophiala sideris]KAK5053541.1 hypothetical protein LTR69_009185 [Exophiala sideris]KAK5179418.1 hypothetical protein LTR44_008257 [Eurotiomycetes sp. CCFEE 6388]